MSARLSEEDAERFDSDTFTYSALVWVAFNAWCIYYARELSVTTAAPFQSGRLVADRDMVPDPRAQSEPTAKPRAPPHPQRRQPPSPATASLAASEREYSA